MSVNSAVGTSCDLYAISYQHRPLGQSQAIQINRRASQPATDHLDQSQTTQLGQLICNSLRPSSPITDHPDPSQMMTTNHRPGRPVAHYPDGLNFVDSATALTPEIHSGLYSHTSEHVVFVYLIWLNFSGHLRRFPRTKFNGQAPSVSFQLSTWRNTTTFILTDVQTAHTYGHTAD